MVVYYHYTPYRWMFGSYLRPGNFGRLIRLSGDTHELFRREAAYEHRRKQKYSEKPSRLNCLFCLPSRSDAALYRRYIHGYEKNYLYEVYADEVGFVARNDRIAYFGNPHFEVEAIDSYWAGAGEETSDEHGSWILKEVLLRGGAYVGRHVPVSIEPAPRLRIPG